MPYFIWIKNNETGEIRRYESSEEFSEFMWSEGNYACDCNRGLFFERVKYEEKNELNWELPECGDTKYSITNVLLENGERDEQMNIFMHELSNN